MSSLCHSCSGKKHLYNGCVFQWSSGLTPSGDPTWKTDNVDHNHGNYTRDWTLRLVTQHAIKSCSKNSKRFQITCLHFYSMSSMSMSSERLVAAPLTSPKFLQFTADTIWGGGSVLETTAVNIQWSCRKIFLDGISMLLTCSSQRLVLVFYVGLNHQGSHYHQDFKEEHSCRAVWSSVSCQVFHAMRSREAW